MNFSEAKENFKTNFSRTQELIQQLVNLDDYSLKYGDYYGYGCEFLISGINPKFYDAEEVWNVGEFIEDEYEKLSKKPNINGHYIPLYHHWDTFLFYSPTDFRGLIFDFSRLEDKNKILAYDGLSQPLTHEIVREFTPEEFLNEYGLSKLFSITHYRAYWSQLGNFSWNN